MSETDHWLEHALWQAAKRIGGVSDEWVEIDGPWCGVGEDRWFTQRIDTEDGSVEYTLNVNQNGSHWTWELTADNSDEPVGFGEFEE